MTGAEFLCAMPGILLKSEGLRSSKVLKCERVKVLK
jgi:hypothetical protein